MESRAACDWAHVAVSPSGGCTDNETRSKSNCALVVKATRWSSRAEAKWVRNTEIRAVERCWTARNFITFILARLLPLYEFALCGPLYGSTPCARGYRNIPYNLGFYLSPLPWAC